MSNVPMYGFGGGSGTGGVLTVLAPAGHTVTISKDGKTKTKTANDDGVAVFKGLSAGAWTYVITDGTQTSQPKTADVAYETTVTASYFSATIHITYPAGYVCTATDGETTLTAPDTSGTWDCVVPNAGEWTVSLDSGFSEVVSVTEHFGSYTVDKWYLFKDGDQYASLTGGWKDGGSAAWGYVAFEDALIKLRMTTFETGGSGKADARATHNNIVSLSGFSTIKLLGQNYTGQTSGGATLEFWLLNSAGTKVASTNLILKGNKEIVELSIPINTLTDPVKVMLHTYYANCDISRIWVE